VNALGYAVSCDPWELLNRFLDEKPRSSTNTILRLAQSLLSRYPQQIVRDKGVPGGVATKYE
jgi:hypothetical protein